MKATAWMAVVPLLGSLAYADSLADAAKRERERREKNKDGKQATVIREDELAAGPRKGSKGTFNTGTESAGGEASADPAAAPPSATGKEGGGDAPVSAGVDATRAAARQRLEQTYQNISGAAGSLMQAVQAYSQCRPSSNDGSNACQRMLVQVATLAIAIGLSMDQAEDAARQGWLSPGEVRDARRRHGMDDARWDQLVAAVRKYRR